MIQTMRYLLGCSKKYSLFHFIACGLIFGAIITLCICAFFGLPHLLNAEASMNNLWKNFKALQNFSHYKDARLKVLSDDLFTFSHELQNLYDHIKNHTLPNGDSTIKTYKNYTYEEIESFYVAGTLEEPVRTDFLQLLTEAVNEATSENGNGTARSNVQVCKELVSKLHNKYEEKWNCFFGETYQLYYNAYIALIVFADGDQMLVYKIG
uniref:Uncharacterized protein n=1 Tax=Acrobeloides nanus TaxID=290746 RepID=A0A914C301_9BILA